MLKHNKIIILLIITLLLTLSNYTSTKSLNTTIITTINPHQPYAFILAGQSNMAINFDGLEQVLKNFYGSDTLGIRCAVGGASAR